MAEPLSKDEIKRIDESCEEFVKNSIRPFNPETTEDIDVFVQPIFDSDDLEERLVFDVYTRTFIYKLYDCDRSRDGERYYKPQLFSYRFISNDLKDDIEFASLIHELAEQNDGWLKAKLKRNIDGNGKYIIIGRAVLRCGVISEVSAVLEVDAIKDASDKKAISSARHFIDKNTDENSSEFPSGKEESGGSSSTQYEVNVYKVGNANAALIEDVQNKVQMLFDCGIDEKNSSAYLLAQIEIQNINPEYIVISHNHEDHFNLLFVNKCIQGLALGINTCALKQIIMQREKIDRGDYFSRALLRNYFKQKLHIVASLPQKGRCLLQDFPNVKFFSGTCRNVNQCVEPKASYLENDKGLIMLINNNKKVIFAGDCSYDFFPPGIDFLDLDYIIVPHHGGKVMMSNNSLSVTNNPHAIAIISSKYMSFFSQNMSGYSAQYDQDIFLNGKGITGREFLEGMRNSYKYVFYT